MVRLGVLYTLNHGSSPCEQTLKIINNMKYKEREGWVNVYKIADTDQLEASIIFSTKEEAEFHSVDNPNYVTTTKIEWEE